MTINFYDPISIVRECKGPALSILWLLSVVRTCVTQEWLERHTGYTDKLISQALSYLSETQRVIHTSAGWMLQEGLQLYLPLPIEESRNISDSPTTTTAIDNLGTIDQAVEEENRVGIIPTRHNLDHVEENLKAFKKWGVGHNEKTIILSSQPEVTPQQIDNIAKHLISEKRFSTGLLITAVKCGDQPVQIISKYSNKNRPEKDYLDWEKT